MAETGREFERLLDLLTRLRAEDGCPWDREQTPATIKRYLLEEVYEVVDAVDHETPDQVAEELGDLIFMALFLAQFYAEQDQFQMAEVLRGVGNKMVRRHPHVFGDRKVDSAREVKLNWEEIKQKEKPRKSLSARFSDIPRALPALMRSYRTLSRLARVLRRPLSRNVLLPEMQRSFSMLLELESADSDSSLTVVLGRLLLLLVAFTQPRGIRAEEALTEALASFFQRVDQVEKYLVDKKKEWSELSEEEERTLWEEI
ncbi:MAG: nucleoside triphosphate pyrophosphohydrolase [Deltaproteobacteria bacterium]